MTATPRLEPEVVRPEKGADVLLGEDWVSPDPQFETALKRERRRSRIVSLNRSPLARKIIIFNLLALVVLVGGVLFLNPFRDSLVLQREQGLLREVQLVADLIEAQTPLGKPVERALIEPLIADLAVGTGAEIFVFDRSGGLLATGRGRADTPVPGLTEERSTLITDFLNSVWEGVSGMLRGTTQEGTQLDPENVARSIFEPALVGKTSTISGREPNGSELFSAAAPIWKAGEVMGVVALTTAEGELERLVRFEREQVLQMFVLALLVSIGLSLLLASTIANPLSDLAAAAELGRDRDARKMAPGRVRIPDLAARPDEIGRLSVAMRGMVAALYDRIDANEQFAADVAHEIKNPLASLRSAVGSLRFVKKEEHREKLLDVIEHDVRRLDRLVSDISNASRLDSELVKEEEEEFNLLKTLSNLGQYLGKQANEKGVDFIVDLPPESIVVRGLEGRLAQVFVNLITNAISFCEDGDAVRVWARRRESRVLVVVEDTGPGIPEQALAKVFKRFYSERPSSDFGNHSGLGLAISKQIVEAHGGVIWAENIRPTDADPTSEPLGARFVVGLPV